MAYSTITSRWQAVQSQPGLYTFISPTRRLIRSGKPVLMLHGTLASHRSWDVLAEQLWSSGFENLYAFHYEQLIEDTTHAEGYPGTVIDYILDEIHPDTGQVVVIGHGAGGSLAYRYWQHQGEAARISFLFMLGAPHNQTIFTVLREQFMEAGKGNKNALATQTISMNFNRIVSVQKPSETVVVNILGNLPGQELFDGVVRGLRLPEAINEVIQSEDRGLHRYLNKTPEITRLILSYLRGERHLVYLKLVGLRMQRDDEEGYSGPVVFEIDGNLMPADVFFKAVTDRLYLFEDRVPPVCTLAYPLSQASAGITIHLKDLSNVQGRRRRMYTRLHIPLRDGESSAHAMQDSEGSDFLWRIVCKRLNGILEDSPTHDFDHDLSRGL